VGDIKCEVWGDGSFARTAEPPHRDELRGDLRRVGQPLNVIARMDEHAADRRQRVGPRVELGRHYHFTIERRARVLRWLLDGAPMLEWDDPEPLAGPGHEYFAFNNWDARVHFDNLVITPL
jgi:hypothetical protein